MENEDLYRNLVIFLKMFKNRPYHLAKHLIENSALTDDFIAKIIKSPDLSDLASEKEEGKNLPVVYFADINAMNDYYNSLTEENVRKSKEEIIRDLNLRLERLIDEEKYEDAARLRDYMSKNKIKRMK
jgi:hypothetical protein